MAERAQERVVRLLGILARTAAAGPQGVPFDRLAEEFGVPVDTIQQDANLLWVTGTPGYGPEDLIDFDPVLFEEGRLAVLEDRKVGRALRLGAREAVVLIAALNALQEAWDPVLGTESRELVGSTLAALMQATGAAATGVGLHLAPAADPEVAARVAEAVRTGHRLRMTYVTGQDVARDREVDPWSLLTGDEHAYLYAWCHTAGDERHFRLDRILSAQVLAAPRTVAPPQRAAAEPFRPAPGAELVTVDLAHRARWVAEQVPVESVTDTADGFRVELVVASDAWLQQLLLRLAPDVRAVTPAGPAGRAAAAARRALAHYQDGD